MKENKNLKFELGIKSNVIIKKRNILKSFYHLKEKNLFFVFAPPGSGKTCLLAQIRDMFKDESLYYRLDEKDNDIGFLIENLFLLMRKKFPFKTAEIDFFYKIPLQKRMILMFDDFHKVSHNFKILRFFSRFIELSSPSLIFLFASRTQINIEKHFPYIYHVFTQKELWFTKEEVRKLYWKRFRKKMSSEEVNAVYDITSGWPIAVNVLIEKIRSGERKRIRDILGERSFLNYIEEEVFTLIPSDLKKGLMILSLLPEVFNLGEVKELLNTHEYITLKDLLKFLESRNLFVRRINKNVWEVHSLFLQFLREKGLMDRDVLRKLKKYYKEELSGFLAKLYFYAKDFEELKKLVKEKYSEIDIQNEPVFLEKICKGLDLNFRNCEEVLILKGIYHRKIGEYEKACEFFERLRRKKDLKYKFIGSVSVAEVKLLKGEFEVAYKVLKSFLRKIPEVNLDFKRIIMSILGSLFLYIGNLKRAEKYYKKALEIAVAGKDHKVILPIEISLSVLYKEKGVINEKVFFSLLKKASQLKDNYNYTVVLLNLADLFYRKGDINKAYEFLEKGKSLSVLHEEFLYIAFLELEGKINIAEGRLEKAQECLKLASVKLKDIGSKYYLSPLLYLGYLYTKKEEYEKAYEVLESVNKEMQNFQLKDLRLLTEGFLNYLEVCKGYKSRVENMEKVWKELYKIKKPFEYIWFLIYLIKAYKVVKNYSKEKTYLKSLNSYLKKFNFGVLIREKEEVLGGVKPEIWIQLLEEFKIIAEGKEIPLNKIKGEKTRKVLKFLFMNLNTPCVEDIIIENFWRNMNAEKAKNTLYFTISEIRKFLKNNALPFQLIRQGESYILIGSEDYLDISHFLNLYTKVFLVSSQKERLKYIEKALKYYKGDLLSCELYSDFCLNKREFYKEKYIDLLLVEGKIFYDMKEYKKAEEVLRKVIEEDPVNVEAYRILVKCFKKQGKEEEVIKIIKKCNKEFYLRLRRKPPSDLLI